MSLPSYQITVIDPLTGDVAAVFDPASFRDLRYSRVLNDIGLLALTIPADNPYRSVFTLDSLVEVYRTSPETGLLVKEETYLTRLTHRFREDNAEWFIVGGMSLNHFLARRLVDPDDDPLVAGGYSTKSGAADTVIRSYCREQIGDLASTDRSITQLTIPPVGGTGQNVGARLRHENLLEAIQDLSKKGEVDFIIERTTGRSFEMTIGVIGSDKTYTTNYPLLPSVVLSPDRGNLSSPSLMIDRKKETNFVYALGQGQGSDRYVVKLAGDGTADSPWNRLEFTTDARNIQKGDSLSVYTQAVAALREHQAKIEFTFEPTGMEPGNIYRLDWDMGDLITTVWGDDNLDLRITSVEVEISETGETIRTTVEPK